MANRKQYASNAVRQAAYRERKRAELAEGGLPVTSESGPVLAAGRAPHLSLEQYVQEALRGAERHYMETSPHATLSTKTLGETLDRAEVYARWRYQALLQGEVNGL